MPHLIDSIKSILKSLNFDFYILPENIEFTQHLNQPGCSIATGQLALYKAIHVLHHML